MKTTRNLFALLALASFTVAFAGAPGMMTSPHADAAHPKAGTCAQMDKMDQPKTEAMKDHHGHMDGMQASIDHCASTCAKTESKEAKKATDPIDHYYLSVD